MVRKIIPFEHFPQSSDYVTEDDFSLYATRLSSFFFSNACLFVFFLFFPFLLTKDDQDLGTETR